MNAPVAPPKAAAVAFPEDPKPLPRFHSKRFSLTLPLPDGHAWRIDDHSRPELVAKHAPTRSTVTVVVFRSEELAGRSQCEAQARERKVVPQGELQVLEEQTGITQETFDTRTVVAIAPGTGPEQPLVGHVMAFGGFLRKCFAFDFATEVDGAADEAILSARLAYARARILGGMQIEALGAVQREKVPGEPGPASAPPQP